MKPPRFDYHAPDTLDEALSLLAEHGYDAKVLAGGQSLVPAMNLRLAEPEVLVDINRIPGLDGLAVEGDELVVGALVRHKRFEHDSFGTSVERLMVRIAPFVGHPPIRTRGTLAGSLAHADPAAEWCALAVALDARVCAVSSRGRRTIETSAFFDGAFSTALEPDEIIAEVRFGLPGDCGVAFLEEARTAGDFATVAVVCAARVTDGAFEWARIAVAGAEGRPVRAAAAEESLAGAPAAEASIREAAGILAEGLRPLDDAQASGDYRRHLASVLTARALQQAAQETAA